MNYFWIFGFFLATLNSAQAADGPTTAPEQKIDLVKIDENIKVAKFSTFMFTEGNGAQAYSLNDLVVTLIRMPESKKIFINIDYNTFGHLGGWDGTPRKLDIQFMNQSALLHTISGPRFTITCSQITPFHSQGPGNPDIPSELFQLIKAVRVPQLHAHTGSC